MSIKTKVMEFVQKNRFPRLIVDTNARLGKRGRAPGYRTDIVKEELSRRFVLERSGSKMRFLDVGGRDGKLTYLLGIHGNLDFDQAFYDENRLAFNKKYEYFSVDLHPAGPRVLAGDICSEHYLEVHGGHIGFFDVVYSNNVFEHLAMPWVAARNLYALLKPGGICITIVPFAQRYHQSPADYFRFTHTAIPMLFSLAGPIRDIASGYDIQGRRNDWQGGGERNDIVPEDRFGAWRETWFTVNVLEKPSA